MSKERIVAAATAVTVLDGGMGHMLRRLGTRIEGRIGSQQRFLGVALTNIENPGIVIKAHRAFIAAGADVITTNNYSVVPATLALTDGKYSEADLVPLVRRAAALAHRAVSEELAERTESINSHRKVKVAGSLPPLRESYRYDQVPPEGALDKTMKVYRQIVAGLAAEEVDILLAETMSCAREATAAAMAAAETAPATELWIGYTLAEDARGVLRSGETVAEAIEHLHAADALHSVSAVLFNCSTPESIEAALPQASRAIASCLPPTVASNIHIGGYANAFTTANSDGSGSDYDDACTPEAYAKITASWYHNYSAKVIGGCCGIFPEHIQAIAQLLR